MKFELAWLQTHSQTAVNQLRVALKDMTPHYGSPSVYDTTDSKIVWQRLKTIRKEGGKEVLYQAKSNGKLQRQTEYDEDLLDYMFSRPELLPPLTKDMIFNLMKDNDYRFTMMSDAEY